MALSFSFPVAQHQNLVMVSQRGLAAQPAMSRARPGLSVVLASLKVIAFTDTRKCVSCILIFIFLKNDLCLK